jgi:hypothetical protein
MTDNAMKMAKKATFLVDSLRLDISGASVFEVIAV